MIQKQLKISISGETLLITYWGELLLTELDEFIAFYRRLLNTHQLTTVILDLRVASLMLEPKRHTIKAIIDRFKAAVVDLQVKKTVFVTDDPLISMLFIYMNRRLKPYDHFIYLFRSFEHLEEEIDITGLHRMIQHQHIVF